MGLGGEHYSHMFNVYYFLKSNIVRLEIIFSSSTVFFIASYVIYWTENSLYYNQLELIIIYSST